jgi:hypothetical protein
VPGYILEQGEILGVSTLVIDCMTAFALLISKDNRISLYEEPKKSNIAKHQQIKT